MDSLNVYYYNDSAIIYKPMQQFLCDFTMFMFEPWLLVCVFKKKGYLSNRINYFILYKM